MTPGRDASVAFIGWVSPEVLGIAEHVGGNSHLTALNISSGKDVPELNATFPESIGAGDLAMSISVSHEHTIAIVRSSFERALRSWRARSNSRSSPARR